jgi:NAD-dependent SIR2 family protein deacetylase
VDSSRRLVVLTGAGCSTESGIPDYRAHDGRWKRRPPVRYHDFVRQEGVRRRYWARGFAGWPAFARARPNAGHVALAWLETLGILHHVITQNVDGLHQSAGNRRVIDLHGRLDRVVCLQCGSIVSREDVQRRLRRLNPHWFFSPRRIAPDGDADLAAESSAAFHPPPCERCRGVLKPDVVFFGEAVPVHRVRNAFDRLGEADALLVAGSSLMVWSGFRFAREAARRGVPIAIINEGRTRADELAAVKIDARCGEALPSLLAQD